MAGRATQKTGMAMPDEPVRLLMETLPHIAFLIAPSGKAIFYNKHFRDYAGPSLGPTPAHRAALHHPDDRERVARARTKGTATRNDYITEARLRRHDGTYRWHRVHNKPMRRDGRLVSWLGTAVDVHDTRQVTETLERRVAERTAELEASEARFQTLYNRTPMALHSVDAQGRLIEVNDHWLALFGTSWDDAIGRSPAEFMAEDSARRYVADAWPAMLASDGATQTVECRFRRRSGEVFDGRLSARGEFDGHGAFVRSWSAIADITLEKRTQAELLYTLKTDAVGQLTSGIAHDFNNLLTAIVSGVELLRSKRDDAKRSERLLNAIGEAGQRGATLTRQLLAFGRRQRLSLEVLGLNALVDGLHELLRRTLGPTIHIEITPGDDSWTVMGDRSQLELVVMNLALNARDAMPSGGRLVIAVEHETLGPRHRPEHPDAGEYVTLSVTDDGSGIPAEVADRVFDPFFTTKSVGKGSGLGLPQVLGVAQQLGGGVRVLDMPDGGTRVMVSLPRLMR